MLLIENKCDINVTDKSGNTPLLFAVYENNMVIVRILVEALCDITIRGNENKTAAEIAKEFCCHAIAEYLAKKAPRVQVRSTKRARAAP